MQNMFLAIGNENYIVYSSQKNNFWLNSILWKIYLIYKALSLLHLTNWNGTLTTVLFTSVRAVNTIYVHYREKE